MVLPSKANGASKPALDSASQFRTLADYAPLVVWMTDARGECTFISRFWKKLTGRDPKKDLGYRWCNALHPEDQARAANDLIEAVKKRIPCEGEYRVRRPNGHYAWVLDRGVPSFEAGGAFSGHIGTCVDVTARKTLETKIDSLLLGMEAERKRIARELHDDLGQKLALLGVTLSDVEHLPNDRPEMIKKKLRQARGLVDEIASDTHLISHNLHPAILSHLGLVPALRRLCQDFSAQKKIVVEFDGESDYEDPPPEISTALFRIAQECLSNVIKHSGASRAKVELFQGQTKLQLVVTDNGRGFDTSRTPASGGLGLISVRERVRMIGGEIEINSAPSRGVQIRVIVPNLARSQKAIAA